MNFVWLVFLIILSMAAWCDWKYRGIPKYLIWLLFGIAFVDMALSPALLFPKLVSFGGLYVLGGVLNKKMRFGRGDWLVISTIGLIFGVIGLISVALGLLAGFVASTKQSDIQLIPFLSLSSTLVFAAIIYL